MRGNDINLNNVFGNLPMFAADARDILAVLDTEHGAVVNLVRNGGTVFAALSQNQTALRNLITSSDTVFKTTAANQAALADTIHVFPTFLDQSQITMRALQDFAINSDQACCVVNSLGRQNAPLLKELIPVAKDLGPTLQAVQRLSPPLKKLFVNLNPLITVSRTGLPATAEFLRGLGCIDKDTPGQCPSNPAQQTLLPALGTFLEQLNPILNWLGQHQQLTSDFISNGGTPLSATSTTVGGSGSDLLRRALRPLPAAVLDVRPRIVLDLPDPLTPTTAATPTSRRCGVRTRTCSSTTSRRSGTATTPAGSTCRRATRRAGTLGCWVAPPLPGTNKSQQFPHILQAHYPNK